MPPEVEDDFGDGRRYTPTKISVPPFITFADLAKLLLGNPVAQPTYTSGPPSESRIHVGLSPSTKTAARGMLFQTEGVRLGAGLKAPANPIDLAERPRTDYRLRIGFGADLPDGVALIGGETRVGIRSRSDSALLPTPKGLTEALANSRRILMILATPASFAGGWRPGWINPETMSGTPPGSDVRLKLISAAAPRKQAASGWDAQLRMPKAVRWLAPAGAVYFFEVAQGDPGELASHWMCPVSDSEQGRLDGEGSALWGIY